jgi:two-component system sensor histidine kinase/response regulator
VDDQSETRQTLCHLLSALGVGLSDGGLVKAVAVGEEALLLVEQGVAVEQPYDLVLLDWVMPGMGGAEVLTRMRQLQPQLVVVVVSAYGSDSLRGEAMKGGAHTFLAKPILPESVRHLLQRLKGDNAGASAQLTGAAEAVRLDDLRVLLVEDNALNQQFATELLARRGARVDVAANGCEALERMRHAQPAPYDVVLMDLQMPVMDGYEATRLMREDPAISDIPVIAMTAHAMSEERARCLALGMVNHITKPLDPGALYAALAPYCHVLPGHDLPTVQSTRVRRPEDAWPAIEGIDIAVAMDRFEGDLALYHATLSAFLTHAQGVLAWLPGSIGLEDWPAVEREAHTLKGLGGTIGHAALQGYARRLEEAAKAKDADRVQHACELLIQVMAPFVKSLQNDLFDIEAAQVVHAAARDVREQDLLLAQRLKQLTGECDSEALALWQRHRAEFAAWLPAVVTDRLNAALARCDFDSAFGLLDELDLEAKLK